MSWWQMLTYPFRPQPRQPLAKRQPAREAQTEVPLGMEATDMSIVAEAARRNDAFERVNDTRASNTKIQHRAIHVKPMADDETYAAQYFGAFQKKGKNL